MQPVSGSTEWTKPLRAGPGFTKGYWLDLRHKVRYPPPPEKFPQYSLRETVKASVGREPLKTGGMTVEDRHYISRGNERLLVGHS